MDKTFYIYFNKDSEEVTNEIIDFINNDCYKFIVYNFDKQKECNNLVKEIETVLCDLKNNYVGKKFKLKELLKDKVIKEAYNLSKKVHGYYFYQSLDTAATCSKIDNELFKNEFEVAGIDDYYFVLAQVIPINYPGYKNSNYLFKFLIDGSCMFFKFSNGRFEERFNFSDLKDFLFSDIKDFNPKDSYLVFDIFYHCAERWAIDLFNKYQKNKKKEESVN